MLHAAKVIGHNRGHSYIVNPPLFFPVFIRKPIFILYNEYKLPLANKLDFTGTNTKFTNIMADNKPAW